MLMKQVYSAPEAELVVVRFEENILGSNGNGLDNGHAVPLGAPRRMYSFDDYEDEE